MQIRSIEKELRENAYPGRGIILGKSPDGKKAVAAYFIMGRSENSRNRIFVEDGEGIRTQAFDPAKLTDPSLIIYAPVRVLGNKTIVTNGDQTDTIYEGMDRQLTFEQSLRCREFEPDAPNYTPRISGIMHIEERKLQLRSCLSSKSNDGDPEELPPILPLPMRSRRQGKDISSTPISATEIRCPVLKESRNGSRWRMRSDAFTRSVLWNSLNEENKVSLFVRYIDIATGNYETRIVNKNQIEKERRISEDERIRTEIRM